MCLLNGHDACHQSYGVASAHAALDLPKAVDKAPVPSVVGAGKVAPPNTSKTVTIFDWDDTLLCTSFLSDNDNEIQACLISEADDDVQQSTKFQAQLQDLSQRVVDLLELSIAAGQVFIITNASEGWVEESAAIYIPEIVPMLAKVHIISARASYEDKYPGEMKMWKRATFLDLQHQFDMKHVTSLISLGDSDFEMEAAHYLGSALAVNDLEATVGGYPEATTDDGLKLWVKTVKFRQRPSPPELQKQLELVIQKFTKIVATKKSLSIQFREVLPAPGQEALPGAACAA